MSTKKYRDEIPSKFEIEQAESDSAETKLCLHDDHKRPTNRREFLATGLLGFSGYMIAPSVLSILSRSTAWAQSSDSCEVKAAFRLPAFIGVNLTGGASLSSNYLPLDQGGNPLPSYDILGLGNAPPVETEFGNATFPGAINGQIASNFLAGVRTAASRSTLDRTAFVGVCVPNGDDTANNKLDASGLVALAGLTGQHFTKLGSQENAANTGIRQNYAGKLGPAPFIVRNINSLLQALQPPGALVTRLNNSQRDRLYRLVNSLSSSQARKIATADSQSGTTLAKLVQCATGKNIELATETNPGIDPRLDTTVDMTGLWSLNNGGALFGRSQNDRLRMSAMVYNALNGNAGAVGFDLGGYDYHGNGKANQIARDDQAGQLVGKVLESAAIMNQPAFIVVTTDGAVGFPRGGAFGDGPTSDRGQGGMAYILAYRPTARPETKSNQIGFYTSGQVASDKTISGSAELAGKAIFANWCAFAGRTALYEKTTGTRVDASELDQMIRIVGS